MNWLMRSRSALALTLVCVVLVSPLGSMAPAGADSTSVDPVEITDGPPAPESISAQVELVSSSGTNCSSDRRRDSARLAGFARELPDVWGCWVFAYPYAKVGGKGQTFCGLAAWALVSCTQRVKTDERWVNVALNGPGRAAMVLSIREQRKHMQTCVAPVLTPDAKTCRTYTVGSKSECELLWEYWRPPGKDASRGSSRCYS
jgi:hypothetical protein